MKKCIKCWIEKELSEFYKNKAAKDWLKSYCKICSSIIAKESSRTIPWLVTRIYSNQRASSKRRGHSMPNYTKEQLKEWIIEQPNFNELYSNQIKSNYKKMLRLSCDRTDDNLWYCLTRLKLITWQENKDKWSKDMRDWILINWVNPQKAVIWTNKKTWIKTEYHSVREACRQTWVNHWNISQCCKWKLKTTWGYKWSYFK